MKERHRPIVGIEEADPASRPSTALQKAFFDDIAARYPGWTPSTSPSADPGELCPPSGGWFVARIGPEPVGCGGFKRLDAKYALIKRVFVVPDKRRNGIGAELLSQILLSAGQSGYEGARLDTADGQPEAISLFELFGFVDIENFNGNPFATRWMELLFEDGRKV